ncbi:hypothetical protein [Cytobacillus sp. FSL H8-0458]|uniref:hypothetical protein n=1 Tax=Cytobacillus sp. FSL H8-0458 TaxID=2975346 RepID=UPI0030F5D2FB
MRIKLVRLQTEKTETLECESEPGATSDTKDGNLGGSESEPGSTSDTEDGNHGV